MDLYVVLGKEVLPKQPEQNGCIHQGQQMQLSRAQYTNNIHPQTLQKL